MNPESQVSSHMEGFGVSLNRGRGIKEEGEGCVTTRGFFIFFYHTLLWLLKKTLIEMDLGKLSGK